ncbi:MAG TPA: serine hydrolase [Candidatus Corynebacterium avicola]|uniref:Serine hydrolase n=1 Tax=Candidatus Corynebacterium avicola TaxID=2838527 RepID=A0A9D1RQ92_9CORY|nr:serine hydrolase [Candidatus Corynebacterium avicola]
MFLSTSLPLRRVGAAVLVGSLMLASPATAEVGRNGVDKDDWLPLTPDPGEPLPDDPFLDTDDCPFAEELPPAFDSDALPGRGEEAPAPVPVELPGPGGEDLDTCGEVAASGMTLPNDLSLGAYSVYDIDSGEVLAAKDPYGLYRPASIIKALLLLTALDELDLQQRIPVSEEAANVDGSAVGIGVGGRYTARQLLLGLVMRSGNDAAIALSEAMGGQDAVVEKMQDLADSLGTTATRVTTVHGLDSAGVQTTAYDLSLIYQAVFQNEDALKLLGTESMDFPGYGDYEGFEVSSDNPLLFSYPGTLGGKTGFTDNARHTFAVAAERDGRRLGVVLLNSTIAAGRPAEQAEKLLDAGFDAPEEASVGELVAADTADTADTADEDAAEDEVAAAEAAPEAADSSDSSAARYVRVAAAVSLIVILLAAAGFVGARFRRGRG